MNELTNKIMNTLKNSNLNNAILINGKWGSGKTYYVKNELIPKLEVKDKNEDSAVIYISLYGIKNLDDISKESVEHFASIYNIIPSIVYGRLMNDGYMDWNKCYNRLRYDWL